MWTLTTPGLPRVGDPLGQSQALCFRGEEVLWLVPDECVLGFTESRQPLVLPPLVLPHPKESPEMNILGDDSV